MRLAVIFAVLALLSAPPPPARALPAAHEKQEERCPHCGTRTVKNAKFCHECGADLRKVEDPSKFKQPNLGIKLTVPADNYEIRTRDFKFGWNSAVCEIVSKDGEVGGVITHYVWGARAAAFADWRENSWKTTKGVKEVKPIKTEDVRRPYGDCVRREYLVDYENRAYHYLEVFIGRGSRNLELALWVLEPHWEEYRKDLYKIADALEYSRVWRCPGCRADVRPDAKVCDACTMPLAPPNETLAAWCRKYEIQLVTDASKYYPIKTASGSDVAGKGAARKTVERFCELLAGELKKYPEDFFRKLQLERLVLCRELKRDGSGFGGLSEYDSDTIHFEITEGWDIDHFMKSKIHHELFHFIDYRDDLTIDKDDAWEKLNASDFHYNPKKVGTGGLDDSQKGFLNTYSQGAIGEDKAEVFGYVVAYPGAMATRSQKDAVIGKKAARIRELARSYCAAFDDAFWKSLSD